MTTMCSRWQRGQITNAEYLHFLNFAANRSFNDATQYPVFPWVITDYSNDTFPAEPELKAPKSVTKAWRNLTRPVGALSADKFE